MTKKVAFIVIQYSPTVGGLQAHIKGIENLIKEIGYETAVVTSTPNPDMIMDGTIEKNVFQLPVLFWFKDSPIINPLKFYKTIKSIDPDIVHLVYPFPLYLDIACIYGFFNNKNVICTYIDDVIMEFPYSLFIKLYEMTLWYIWKNIICSISASSKEYGKNSSGINKWRKKLYFVPPPVFETDFNLKLEHKYEAKKKLGLDNYDNIAIFVGSLRHRLKYKRPDVILEAWSKYIHENNDNSILLIVGDGELKSKYEKMASDLGLTSKNVVFKGFVSRKSLINCYLASDLFILPSEDNNEAFGITPVEAMLYGNAVIASDIPGLRGSLKKIDTNVTLVNPSNSEKIAKKIKYWFSKDITDYSLENHRYVKEFLNNDEIKKELIEMYNDEELNSLGALKRTKRIFKIYGVKNEKY